MVTKSSTDKERQAVRLERVDLVRTDDGNYQLPVILTDDGGQQTREYLTIEPNDASRLHAQLERNLNRGWAMTEYAKVARQIGETHNPVSGSGRSNSEEDRNDSA